MYFKTTALVVAMISAHAFANEPMQQNGYAQQPMQQNGYAQQGQQPMQQNGYAQQGQQPMQQNGYAQQPMQQNGYAQQGQQPMQQNGYAQQERQAYGAQSAQSVAQAPIAPRDDVNAKMNNYIASVNQKLMNAGRAQSVEIVSGSAPLTVSSTHADWSRYRANTLRQATIDAKNKYLQGLNVSVKNEVVTEFFMDEGAPAPTANDFKSTSAFESLIAKATALASGKLDNELTEMGIDPSEFKSASPSQKQMLLKDSFAEKTITRAYGDMSAMFVIKTFESYKDDGTGQIGVVLARSAKKRDQVKAMIDSKGHLKPQPDKADPMYANIPQALASTNAPYLEYGTTLAYDAQGFPMLISYGQAGVQHTDNERLMDKKRKAAFIQARSNAMANLAQTYNMSGNFNATTSEERVAQQELVHTLASSNSMQTTDPGVVDSLRTTMEESAKMTAQVQGLNGLQTMHEWEMKHPITGHEMVGLAVVWHPQYVQNAGLIQSGRTVEQVNQERGHNGAQAPAPVVTQESKSRFDPDF